MIIIYFPINHLGCFQLVTATISVAVINRDSHVQEFLKVLYLKMEWPGQRLCNSSLLDIAKLLSIVFALNFYFHQQCIRSPVCPILPNSRYCQILTFLPLE